MAAKMPVGSKSMKTAKSPSEAFALTNCVAVSKRDFDPATKYILVNDRHVFSISFADTVAPGELGFSAYHRNFASLSLNMEVKVRPYDPLADGTSVYMATLNLQVSFYQKATVAKDYYDTADLGKVYLQGFKNQVFATGQKCQMDYKGTALVMEVMSLEVMEFGASGGPTGSSKAAQMGVLFDQTQITFSKSADSSIKLKGSGRSAANAIVQPNFKFEDMGIGGLDKEFSGIFRRAFASRIFPPSLVERLGIQHVKGILLFGPPGTGKTLMARQIGKMLNAREPIIVNGPEILNKFVGQSEENVRKLFAAAEAEYKQKGDESSLHIIIFDELDAICKQRGSKNDGTGVGDSVVNQLLSKMDGVEQLNNILIIGMTNRLDMIDEALLRPGRLEIHMEISLPDENGRFQIINIHTSKMRTNHLLEDDVDLRELAAMTKNFSGAEIAGLIKSATSFSFNRHVKVGTLATVSNDYEHMKISREDFMSALEEVHPAFGVSESELQTCVTNGIIKFRVDIERILGDGKLFVEQVRNSSRTPLVSVLIHGPSGGGKTALAATIALASEFPFIKLISPETMVGFTEQAKMSAIQKVFNDSYKSPLSVIVVDSIERILDWVAIGPRFSNSVLQTLLVLLKKAPPPGKRLLIIGTTNQRTILEQMELIDVFNSEIYVPTVTDLRSLDYVVNSIQLFKTESDRQRAMSMLKQQGMDTKLSIGIKKLLMVAEMARQDVDLVDKFVYAITVENGGIGGTSICLSGEMTGNSGMESEDELRHSFHDRAGESVSAPYRSPSHTSPSMEDLPRSPQILGIVFPWRDVGNIDAAWQSVKWQSIQKHAAKVKQLNLLHVSEEASIGISRPFKLILSFCGKLSSATVASSPIICTAQ
ncbi:hypothetical protein SmJEL517_g05720 [Synchytrium microbalum]|uniref:Vesicular-fusion protein SEC18 n=1 Tax=Synchytrium microbalum TaxID=1806994 RepID=A0A507BZN5_9FUNG|nr:uncharacterized protein SmJEL517_g05720 [Synchytrium microbalum]TPX30795.1 hypothetical protein SmJEL517_g05720 [Synchytrium microbalum]